MLLVLCLRVVFFSNISKSILGLRFGLLKCILEKLLFSLSRFSLTSNMSWKSRQKSDYWDGAVKMICWILPKNSSILRYE